MQPRTHELFLLRALGLGTSSWTNADLPALLAGDRDEDDFVVPVLRLRIRAAGLTHTYRPGRSFGDLFAENAKTKLLRCIVAARRMRTRRRAAWWLGRACHLLGDMAVPARTRGVWHLEGDPLEAFIETAVTRGATFDCGSDALGTGATALEGVTAAEIAEALASASAALPADTTRTPWGRALYRVGRGVRLDDAAVEAQAAQLVPLAIAHVAALLGCVPRP